MTVYEYTEYVIQHGGIYCAVQLPNSSKRGQTFYLFLFFNDNDFERVDRRNVRLSPRLLKLPLPGMMAPNVFFLSLRGVLLILIISSCQQSSLHCHITMYRCRFTSSYSSNSKMLFHFWISCVTRFAESYDNSASRVIWGNLGPRVKIIIIKVSIPRPLETTPGIGELSHLSSFLYSLPEVSCVYLSAVMGV